MGDAPMWEALRSASVTSTTSWPLPWGCSSCLDPDTCECRGYEAVVQEVELKGIAQQAGKVMARCIIANLDML